MAELSEFCVNSYIYVLIMIVIINLIIIITNNTDDYYCNCDFKPIYYSCCYLGTVVVGILAAFTSKIFLQEINGI